MHTRLRAVRVAAMAIFALVAICCGSAVAAGGPQRVVSMNVCTDQLAMLIAGEGQLHSVSYLAADPTMSVLAGQAKGFLFNHAQAEEILLMHPDLVLAGTYTSHASVGLLRRLGLRVEQFAPESSIGDIRANILRMGELLGREKRAGELVDEFDREIAGLAANRPPRRTVALYDTNSYTSGEGTLADAIVREAGLENIAGRLGLTGNARVSLELLVLSAPDLVVNANNDYGAPALAEENFAHPAWRALLASSHVVTIPVPYTVCGAPFTLEAVRRLQAAAWAQGQAR